MAFLNYVLAGYPLLWVQTYEEHRALITFRNELNKAKEPYRTYTWDIIDGIREMTIKDGAIAFGTPIAVQKAVSEAFGDGPMPPEPIDPVNWLENQAPDNSIVFLKDYHAFLQDPILRRKIRNVIQKFQACHKVLVTLSPMLKIPEETEKEFTVVNFDLPTREELKMVLRGLCKAEDDPPELKRPKYPENDGDILDAALGMTAIEADNAFSVSLVEKKKFDAGVIRKEKASIIKKTGILEIVDSHLTMEDIGGLENLKDWLVSRKDSFSEKAREFGVRPPKALLLLGVAGCGKSLTSKVVANAWGRPLLRLDLGQVYGKYVGESEDRLRQVFRMATSVSPCILWIDELEKSFAGNKGSSDSDSGVGKRILQGMLTFMQENTADVFIVATANAVASLPPEFLNRFEKTFWVDLPDEVQRAEIIKIHLVKAGRKDLKVNMKALVEASKEFNGREIEAWIKESVSIAFSRGHEDVTNEDLLDAAKDVTPISRMMKADISTSRDWSKARGIKNASKEHKIEVAPETLKGRKLGEQS
jgi:SpoVK/Ycf46/Vps4 family AAA+-type ATPase